MYFGVVNITKGHRISSYWKSSPPSKEEVYTMFHRYGWDEGDKIFSYCYCEGYEWKNGDWVSEYEDMNKTHETKEIEPKLIGFEHAKYLVTFSHVPKWKSVDEKICLDCLHIFNPKTIESDKQYFDGTFHCI